MASESILTALTDCSIGNQSNNDDENIKKASLHDNNRNSKLFQVHGINHQHNNKTICRFKNKKKFKTMTTNESITSYTSNVWQYAIRCPDSNYSTCCLCPDNKKISTHNGSTSTLRKHLISKHNLHDLALSNEKRKSTKHSISIQRQQELHTLCIYCIIKDGRTFNDLHKPGMKKLLQELIPGYEPPNRHMVARRLKRLHIFYQKKLIEDLVSIDHISITLDFWSNRQMKSFLVITGHYFSVDSYNLKSTILNFSVVDEEHKSDEISQLLRRKLKELNILHKVVRVTVDGAKNIVRALDSLGLGFKRIWCIAHRLHLTITNAFGFWIAKKEHSQDIATIEAQQRLQDISSNQEEERIGMVEFEYNNELDQTNTNFIEDIQLDDNDNDDDDDDELLEEGDVGDEDLLSDVTDEQIIDNWTTEVSTSEHGNIYDQDIIACIIRKCRALVLTIKSSMILTLFFDKERETLNIKRNLCYDVKSRWNSTYCMIDTLLVLREVIEKLFNQKHNLHISSKCLKKLATLELKSDDWIMLSALHTVLKPFFHATKVLSGRDYPSIGLSFYLLSRLKNFLQKQEKKENVMIKRLKQLLLSQYAHYFESDDEQVQLLKFHSYFDPAGFTTLTETEKNSIEEDIKSMITDSNCDLTESTISTQRINLNTNKSDQKLNLPRRSYKNVIEEFNESIGQFNSIGVQCDAKRNERIDDDIRNYRKYVAQFYSTQQIDVTSSTLFWQTYAQSFPNLAKLARNYLSTPATSVPSESCFSMSSFLARKERSRLTGDNLASSVFLKDKINY